VGVRLEAELARVGQPAHLPLRLGLDDEVGGAVLERAGDVPAEADLLAGEAILAGVVDVDAGEGDGPRGLEVIDGGLDAEGAGALGSPAALYLAAARGGVPPHPSPAVPTRYVPAPSRDLNNRIVDRDLTTDERMLFVSIDKADYETVDLMLKKGVDINAYYVRMGTTPLGRAMEQDNRAMMQFLLERGADVRGYVYEKKDYHVFSYLVAAVQRRDLGLVEYLHNWGAGINSVSWDYNHGYHNALFRLGVSAEDVPINSPEQCCCMAVSKNQRREAAAILQVW